MGLPDRVQACLFDLDGVLTETAKVHATAWREMSGACLRAHARRACGPFAASGPAGDHDAYLDGKPRAGGTRSLPGSHAIMLPEGAGDDPPGAETVRGLGDRKNQVVQRRIRQDGVQAYDGPVRCVRAVRLRRAVVSTGTNGADVLAAARALEAGPADGAVSGDVLTGVAARCGGGFGAGQAGHASELQAHGADVVVAGLAELPEES